MRNNEGYNQVETCISFSIIPGKLLKSGCTLPQNLMNGVIMCLKDGMTCHVNCNPGYKLHASRSIKYMECINNQWSHSSDAFRCIPDCEYTGKSRNPACKGLVLWSGTSPPQTFHLPEFISIHPACQIPDPGMGKWEQESIFEQVNGNLYGCNHLQCKKYNVKKRAWITITGLKFSSERRNAAGVLIGDKWIVQGGRSGLKNVKSTEVWTPSASNWVEDSKYTSPLPVSGHCLVNINGKLMQIGGFSSTLRRATSRCFLDGQEVSRLKSARYFHACAVSNGQVWVAGGSRDDNNHNVVEIYDPATNSWSDGSKRPKTTFDYMPQLVDYLGQLFYIGGDEIGIIYKVNRNKKWEEVRDIEKGYKFAGIILDNYCSSSNLD